MVKQILLTHVDTGYPSNVSAELLDEVLVSRITSIPATNEIWRKIFRFPVRRKSEANFPEYEPDWLDWFQ
jgi:hypothetical protein